MAHTVQRKCAACDADRILPQLEVGPADDPLEIEADAMADRVVRRQAADMGDDDDRDAPSLQAAHAVQRKCAACEAETRILPQLEVGPVDDPLETEADVMADHVVRRQAADTDDDERPDERLQAKAKDTASSESTTSGFDTGLANASGSGAALASHTRDQMENAFAADFSAVRVHTGDRSAAMNEEIGARAFTYGTDIHFNSGEFAPGTERGTRLLAHELTHVVQQNSRVRRAPKRIQAKLLVFGPPSGIPTGTQIHNYGVLPLFRDPELNPGLWVEEPVPGANKDKDERGRSGNPDFYRASAPNAVPIGINVNRRGGLHRLRGAVAVAAPRPPATRDGPVRDLANAPTKIELGDLKPGHSAEEWLGADQLRNYSTGIKNTATAVNKYQERREYPERWDPLPDPQPMGHLDIPELVRTSRSGGLRYSRLNIWEWSGSKAVRYEPTAPLTTVLRGSLIVYKSSVSGIWAYEWMPENVPATLGNEFYVQQLLNRLINDVQPRLQSATTPTPKLKNAPSAASQRPPRQAVRRLLRRKPKKHQKFDEKAWQGAYNPWRTDADKALGESKTKRNEAVLKTLTESKKRTGFDPKIPQEVKERSKGFATVRHWIRYGKLYAWFRKTFDRVYVKLAGFAKSVKEKVKGLIKSGGSSGFGNWVKAAALALFKVAKKFAAFTVSMVMDKLLDSLQEGVINIVKQLADAATPEGVKSKIEEVEERKAQFEQMLAEAQENLEKRLFGDTLELFTKLDKYMEIAKTISTIVSIVKWGIRILACASPPLLGCLWNLAISALEWAFSKIMETCWFSAKVLGWVKDTGVSAILNFPTDVANTIAKRINSVVPLPDGIGPLFLPSHITIHHSEFNIKCEPGGGDGDGEGGGAEPTEEQKALMDLAKEFGDDDAAKDKLEAFLEMAAKRAADHNVMLDAERIRKLGPLIRSLSIEQMKQIAANQPVDGIPVPVEDFLKSIATLTQAETERKAARKIDYEKAQKSNASFEKNEIGWNPELFVKPDIPSDSKEFADAIFDIQQILGLKADGMAGPKTTKAFYEKNKQPKDQAYENAVTIIKLEESARAEAKATAEAQKEYERWLKDPKIKAKLDEKFPSEDQLKKDLLPLNWRALDTNSFAFIKVKGRGIVGFKTTGDHCAGAYFNYVEQEFGGVTLPMVVKTSKFYALDDMSNEAVQWWLVGKDGKKEQTTEFLEEKKDTFFRGPHLAGALVEIQ